MQIIKFKKYGTTDEFKISNLGKVIIIDQNGMHKATLLKDITQITFNILDKYSIIHIRDCKGTVHLRGSNDDKNFIRHFDSLVEWWNAAL